MVRQLPNFAQLLVTHRTIYSEHIAVNKNETIIPSHSTDPNCQLPKTQVESPAPSAYIVSCADGPRFPGPQTFIIVTECFHPQP